MNKQGILPNETLQLHEILTFKNTSMTKAVTMSPLVSDNELKTILQQEAATSQKHLEELRDLMKKSNIAASENMES